MIGWPILATLAVAGVSTDRDELAPDQYEVNWSIAPNAAAAEPFWVKEQGKVLETRLVPVEMYVTPSALTAADGTPLVGAGSQLVRFNAAHLLACTIGKGDSGLSAKSMVCLIDRDGDRRFDGYFTRGTGGAFWFAPTGKLPKQIAPIAPIALPNADPSMIRNAPLLALHYQRILDGGWNALAPGGNNFVRFHFTVGNAKSRELIVRDCRSKDLPSYCTSATLPSVFAFAGLKLDVVERQKEGIRVRLLAPFGPAVVRIKDTSSGDYTTGELFVVNDAEGS